MFTQTYIYITLCILLFFSSFGHAIRAGGENTYFNHLVELLVNSKHYISRENVINKSPKNERNQTQLLESIFNVQNYNAKGDGKTDDTQAFEAAWAATCVTENGVMLVPSGFTFLLQPTTFNGIKCQSSVTVQIDGEIVAPAKKSDWKSVNTQWILFTGFSKGLIIQGTGVVNGHGLDWWEIARITGPIGEDGDERSNTRPHAMEIDSISNVIVTGITIQNSPQMHIYFSQCQYVIIFDLTVSSPGDSPNTDGIHLSHTQHVYIFNTTIACGDDCISIQAGCSNVIIENVHCGPGHGYSIGSLGHGGEEAVVSNIGVSNSTVTNASNGVRIKTWEDATGSVSNITFENIIMSSVENPIIMDQYYCNGRDFSKPTGKPSALAITGVLFKKITGTYTKRAVALICSESKPCKEITVDTIDLNAVGLEANGDDKTIYCSNAYGKILTETNPSFKGCFKSDRAVAPTMQLGSV